MKTVLPVAALFLGIGLALGRWSAPTPPAPAVPPASEKAYAGLGEDTVAFLRWYVSNGGADQIQPAVLNDHIRILLSKAAEHGYTMDRLPPTPK